MSRPLILNGSKAMIRGCRPSLQLACGLGTVLFQEKALVASSFGNTDMDEGHDSDCDDDECGGCIEVDDGEDIKEELTEDEVDSVSPAVVANFDKFMAFCEAHDVLSMVDIRKNLVKLFHHFTSDASTLDFVSNLSVISDDVPSCLDTALALRTELPEIIPGGLSDANVAHFIGVLHNHSQSLEEIDGSGLFQYISKLNHSCLPNVNLTVDGTTIWATAIKPIVIGEPLTVDLMDVFYSASNDRAEALATEEIHCNCGYCTGAIPDFARAFKCKDTACDGIVHPTAEKYACTTCHAAWSDEEAEEAEALDMPLIVALEAATTFAEYDAIIAASPLHKYHHVCYMALENLSASWSEEDDAEIEVVCRRMLECINYVVPYPHDEKTQHYDNLAQALISNGNVNGATEAYERAYEMSCLCSGAEYEKSVFYKKLVEHTPASREEWMVAYGLDSDDEDEE
ncbi:hypothetical protein SPRG_04388 [Saprolegnia parasitica CBS 223.65]|uniref:SET domain-containing protein n=1 Tax=Saprolegnia parasitica (strain CBS 223.65) TaxID=695850 RepID=A0A067CMM0_SAPPC|nr:hypothetical protein SPRG_04388 [Saprolegnia parasitica CBS 223.65]KDO30485.1 hypothetical protein SPRG_04388 [Saprolegnia parasitica CBS 223.65]|eukprot:XP_012198707.1 hypothetical protein SPRG_04388 [Saprolegnia parasitica CBS 223.65]